MSESGGWRVVEEDVQHDCLTGLAVIGMVRLGLIGLPPTQPGGPSGHVPCGAIHFDYRRWRSWVGWPGASSGSVGWLLAKGF